MALTFAMLAGCSFDGVPSGGEGVDGGAVEADADAASVDAGPSAPVTVRFRNDDVYSDTHDTMLDSQNADGANGSDVSANWDLDDGHWVLVRFGSIIGADAAQISPDAIVMSATLQLVTIDSSASAEPGQIRQALIPWTEQTTYNLFTIDGQIDGNEMDTMAGIDAPVTEGPHTIDVTSFVQGWVDNPGTNHGWIIEPASTNGISIHSSEGEPQTRPQLEVTYIVPNTSQ